MCTLIHPQASLSSPLLSLLLAWPIEFGCGRRKSIVNSSHLIYYDGYNGAIKGRRVQ